ncbi:hypothetical protein SLEP1_g34195 [Rubroshorea leprosula]|uniref:Uncharacterized protein n=1 Tax=Rubroshorea leprosula TaxID=152421 RepID=A0AAV5KJ91_9ROSI|nr:hypothetical protein SLEP1_g34195 [Rubroshorea leprosula]
MDMEVATPMEKGVLLSLLPNSAQDFCKANNNGFQLQKKRAKKKIEKNMKRLKKEMEEISEEQKSIWEGQRQVRQKFEAMEEECKQLREETKLITMQSRSTQLRLFLMFQILKDRENNDLVRATELTRCLREMISAQQNKQIRS